MQIAGYKPLKIGYSLSGIEGPFTVKDTAVEWDCAVKSVPFKVIPTPKNILTQTWKDEHGDDEYIPQVIYYDSYEMEVSFYCMTAIGTANTKIKNFINAISGKWLQIYDTHTKIGRRHVRFVKAGDNVILYRRGGIDFVEFSIFFKVNDPITDITL